MDRFSPPELGSSKLSSPDDSAVQLLSNVRSWRRARTACSRSDGP